MTPRARPAPVPAPAPTPEVTDDDRALLRDLQRRLRAAGCFTPCHRAYARRLALLVPLFVALFVAALAATGAAWAASCVAAGLVSVQLGIVSHDAGHRVVHRRRAINDLWGHVGMTLVCGLSFSHWRIVHDQHHRDPQDIVRDPDTHYALLFSVHEEAARARRGLAARLRRFQHLYFWPLGALYSWSLRWDSIARLWRDPSSTRVDRWVLPVHYALWLLLPSLVVGPAAALATYAVVSTVIALYLVAIFAPNHMGMPNVVPDAPGAPRSYLRRQIVTSRNVRGGPVLAVALSGLEYQIEHHLFPGIGQPRLRAARPIVHAFCVEQRLVHHEVDFFTAHRDVLGHLARMARLEVPP